MPSENTAFIELNLRAGNLRAGLRNSQQMFQRTMGRIASVTRTAFDKIKRLFFSFRTWATIAASAFTANKFIQEADKMKAAMMGLSSVARFQGVEALEAQQAAAELAADGLLSVGEASLSLKNLLMRGFGLERSIELLKRFKDSAVFGRQGSLSLGQAVVSATEGLKNENSILVDNAGVTKNVSIMWKEYAARIGTTVGKLTQEQKVEAEHQGVMRETQAMVGNAAIFVTTWAGQVAAFGAKARQSMASVGTVMQEVLARLGVLSGLKAKLDGVSQWFEDNKTEVLEWGFVIGGVFQNLPELAKTAWEAVKDITQATWDTMTSTARLVWQRILFDPSYLSNLMLQTGNLLLRGVGNVITTALFGFKNLVSLVLTPLIGILAPFGKAIGIGIQNAMETAKVKIEFFLDKTVFFFKDKINDIKGLINNLINTMNKMFGTSLKPLALSDLVKPKEREAFLTAIDFSKEITLSLLQTKAAWKSQWDVTKKEFEIGMGEITSDFKKELTTLENMAEDNLISKNWDQNTKKIESIVNTHADKMTALMDKIRSSARQASEETAKALGAAPGAGKAPATRPITPNIFRPQLPDPERVKKMLEKVNKQWKEHLEKINRDYSQSTSQILQADFLTLEQKKTILGLEVQEFLKAGGSKVDAERIFSESVMEIQKQKLQKLLEMNMTSEATLFEAKMSFLQTYQEAFQLSMATMEETTFRFYTRFMNWYTGAFATAAEQVIIDGKRADLVVRDLGMSLKRMMVRFAAERIAAETKVLLFGKTAAATQAATAKALMASQLPTASALAAAVSLASFGANAAPAIAGMTATQAAAQLLFAPKMHRGGMVDGSGPGVGNERIRTLERGEFVVRSDRQNIQVQVPENSGTVNNYNTINLNIDQLDRDNVDEVAEMLMTAINNRVDRGEQLKASEVAA